MEVRYVRNDDGSEVDFLAKPLEGSPLLIQVCADLGEEATREREVRSLRNAMGDFPRATPLIVTLAPESASGIPEGIDVVDAPLWFLARS